MDISKLLEVINERHDTNFELLNRYSRGEQGAFALVDASGGVRAVLKWAAGSEDTTKMEQTRKLTQHLHNLGYPAPNYLLVGAAPGGVYSVQEELPGVGAKPFSEECLPQILELNSLQRGQAAVLAGSPDWSQHIVQSVLVGGNGYCLPESLRNYSPATAQLLDLLQDIVTRNKAGRYETEDIVHYDFNPFNILIFEGKVTGVVDWQNPCAGDCTFDLVTLMFYSYNQDNLRQDLRRHILTRIEPGVVGVYLAHLILRQVDWSIRHHDQAVINFWLAATENTLHFLRNDLSWLQVPNLH